jgi:hypothetical protein
MTVPAVVNPALGTTLAHGVAGTPITYTILAQLMSIDGPESEMGTVPTVNLGSTAKTYRKTLFDGNEVSCEMQFDPKSDTHLLLTGLFYGNTQLGAGEPWQIIFADATNGPSKATFTAIITKFGPSGIEPESNLQAKLTIKISGLVVWS